MKYNHIEQTHNKKAASFILPEIIKLTNPKSVIDIGCGTGSFLSVLLDLGINDVLGVEGEWLNKNKLFINKEIVVTKDLEKPFFLERKFDLVISLEVAEHIGKEYSEIFVKNLTDLGDVILFSAALPGQGGQNHLNEQWPEFWQNIFKAKGYSFYDSIRLNFWNIKEVDFWYKQNMFLIVKDGSIDFGLQKTEKLNNLIHPELFTLVLNSRNEFAQNYKQLRWGKESPTIYLKLFIKSIYLKIKKSLKKINIE